MLALLLIACADKGADTGHETTPETTAVDADLDGVPDSADCDDSDPYTYPGADDIPYDGTDQDCDGFDLTDVDGDGHEGEPAGGDDCMDSNPTVHPGATEICYDGLDEDCSGDVETDDCDLDGWDRAGDCNDEDATVHPDAADAWYDGVDSNCDGGSDFDQDEDGFEAATYTGDDCDDLDPAINPDAEEMWDGIDNDCESDIDQLSVREADWTALGSNSVGDQWTGNGMRSIPDLDADGWRDLVVGSPLSDGQNGRIYVLPHQSGSVFLPDDALATIDGSNGEALGISVAVVPGTAAETLVVVGSIGDAYVFDAATFTGGAALTGGDAVATISMTYDAGFVYPWTDSAGDPNVLVMSEFYLGYPTDLAVFPVAALSGHVTSSSARYTLSGEEAMLNGGMAGDLDGDGLEEAIAATEVRLQATQAIVVPGADIQAGAAADIGDLNYLNGLGGTVRAHASPDFDGDGYAELILSEYLADSSVRGGGIVHLIAGPEAMAGCDVADCDQARVEGGVDDEAVRAAEAPADLDGDGTLDLVIAGCGEGSGSVVGEVFYLAGAAVAGGGTLTPSRDVPAFYAVGVDDQFGWMTLPEDADGDGDADLYVSELGETGGVYFFENR